MLGVRLVEAGRPDQHRAAVGRAEPERDRLAVAVEEVRAQPAALEAEAGELALLGRVGEAGAERALVGRGARRARRRGRAARAATARGSSRPSISPSAAGTRRSSRWIRQRVFELREATYSSNESGRTSRRRSVVRPKRCSWSGPPSARERGEEARADGQRGERRRRRPRRARGRPGARRASASSAARVGGDRPALDHVQEPDARRVDDAVADRRRQPPLLDARGEPGHRLAVAEDDDPERRDRVRLEPDAREQVVELGLLALPRKPVPGVAQPLELAGRPRDAHLETPGAHRAEHMRTRPFETCPGTVPGPVRKGDCGNATTVANPLHAWANPKRPRLFEPCPGPVPGPVRRTVASPSPGRTGS